MDAICITKNCGKQAKSRGLCKNCYTSASNAVKRGLVPSWDFLEEQGLVLAATGSQKSAFTVALEDKLKEASTQTAAEVIKNNGGGN